MKKFYLLLSMLSLAFYSSAAVVEINGIYYNLISKAKVAEVSSGTNPYSGSVTIPGQVTYEDVTYDVTAIQKDAFSGCKYLTAVTIANSVTSIGENAFWRCSGLTSVTIGSGVKDIGVRAFFECESLLTITIPDNVTSIGEYAFTGCA